MKKTIKKWIAFLLCLHTVLFVVFQVSSVVVAETDSFGQYITSGDAQESEEVLEETLESEESTEESVEGTFESEEASESTEESTEESVEDTIESEELEKSTEEMIESEESVDASDEAAVIDAGDTEIGDDTETGATLTWMSYEDYRAAEIAKAVNTPEVYVGQTAVFNAAEWDVFFCIPNKETSYEDASFVARDECFIAGKSIEVVITDYLKVSDEEIWFKIEAASEYTLPQSLIGNPYILYTDMGIEESNPALWMTPVRGMFVGETIYVQKALGAAEKGITLNVSELPDFFDVLPISGSGLEWYDLGDITSWSDLVTSTEYRYVIDSSVILIPAEVSKAYNDLMNAEDEEAYNAIMSQLPESITAQFTDKHLANLEEHFEEISEIDPIEYTTKATVGGKEVDVTVYGRIPEGITLSATGVSAETVISEGFDVKDATEIVAALDIKLLNADNSVWQPKAGNRIWVSIGMAELGYEDGSILKLQHKHGDRIDTFDIFVVLDGKVTVGINGFSIFVVSNENSTTQIGEEINNGEEHTIRVGDDTVFYFNPPPRGWREDTDYEAGTWRVTDISGAIYYTIHSNETPDNNGIYAPWIKIHPLKKTTAETQITLTFEYANINLGWPARVEESWTQTYTLNILPPEANEDIGKRIYLRDEVNTSGCIIATLVDENGNVINGGLAGAAFSWERWDDGQKMFIMPDAYENMDDENVDETEDPNRVNNDRINIAKDHGGLLESKAKVVDGKKTYVPTEYRVKVTLADGTELRASYKVYYQSEIINAGFELPDANPSTYTFFANGWPQLYWATTAPGTGANLSRDIEYVDYTGGTNNTSPGFGVSGAADVAQNGVQFAELNAEEFGALYQDIITAPEEDVVWQFAHALRPDPDDRPNYYDSMFIVMGPTEGAQKLTTQAHLEALAQVAIKEDDGTLADGGSVTVKFDEDKMVEAENGTEYTLWYHEAKEENTWYTLSGVYSVPENQYRTRVFFMSKTRTGSGNLNQNYGNLIDSAKVGQYKSYLIEYYEETFLDNGSSVIEHLVGYNESGEALIYSTVPLVNLDSHFWLEEQDYLHEIKINGKMYPYNIRFSGDTPSIFIDKYPGDADESKSSTYEVYGKRYEDYDIVVQIFLRDTVIAVQKKIEFPTTLTTEQKLKIIQDLNDSEDGKGSYKAEFILEDVCLINEHEDPDYVYSEKGTIPITHRDPTDQYTGYLSLGNNPQLRHAYVVRETYTTPLVGLELVSVLFESKLYAYDTNTGTFSTHLLEKGYNKSEITSPDKIPIISHPINLEEDQQIAEVFVTNTYQEKMTTIYYKAVGNGKVALIGATDFKDTPMETLAFYSGTATGGAIHPGKNATFVGWYKDEDCQHPVTAADGVWDKSNNSFKPNPNIIDKEEVTFYAKFETGSIVINRTNAEAGQSFVYHVQGTNIENGSKFDMYVTVECDNNGNGSRTIYEVPSGDYTITELMDWSWRYPTDTLENEAGTGQVTFAFGTEMDNQKIYWLNGYSAIKKNVYFKKKEEDNEG